MKYATRDDGRSAFEIHHKFQQPLAEWYYHIHNGTRLVHDADNLVAVPPHIHDKIGLEQDKFWNPIKEEFKVQSLKDLNAKLMDPKNNRRARQIYKEYLKHIADMDKTFSMYFITPDTKEMSEVLKVMETVAKSKEFDLAKTRTWKKTVVDNLRKSNSPVKPFLLLGALGADLSLYPTGMAWASDDHTRLERENLSIAVELALNEQDKGQPARDRMMDVADAFLKLLNKIGVDGITQKKVLEALYGEAQK